MKSWAVPKGPSLDPRSAAWPCTTEDHPMSYNELRGRDPAGEYGAGKVIVWDRGTWSPSATRRGLPQGQAQVRLHGEKLRGRWTLVRRARAAKDDRSAAVAAHQGTTRRRARPETDSA
jgi:bifunctional non-homologous end joining protein LigD